MKWLRPVSILVAGGLIVLAVIGADALGELQAARRLEDARAALRKAGLPATAEDMRKHVPAPPKSENAAPLYRAIIAEWNRSPDSRRLQSRRTANPAGDREILRKLGPLLDRTVRATERPFCHWDRPWEQSYAMLLPEYASLKSIQTALLTRAELTAKTDPAAAFRDLHAAAQMGQHLGQEPIVIAQMVRISLERRLGDSLTRILEGVPNPRAHRDEALAVLQAMGPVVPFRNWFLTEMPAYMIWVDRERSLGTDGYLKDLGVSDLTFRQRIGMIPTVRRAYHRAVASATIDSANRWATAKGDPAQIARLLEDRDDAVLGAVARWQDPFLSMVAGSGWKEAAQLSLDEPKRREGLRHQVLRLTKG